MKKTNFPEEIIKNFLSRDMLLPIKNLAENGCIIAQLALGEIYFYGIIADDEYVSDLMHVITVMNYSKSSNSKKRHSVFFRTDNWGVFCTCSKEPEYKEALRWYTMSAAAGNQYACQKAEITRKILSGGKATENKRTSGRSLFRQIQIFSRNPEKITTGKNDCTVLP